MAGSLVSRLCIRGSNVQDGLFVVRGLGRAELVLSGGCRLTGVVGASGACGARGATRHAAGGLGLDGEDLSGQLADVQRLSVGTETDGRSNEAGEHGREWAAAQRH
jgi:hypothetical protein